MKKICMIFCILVLMVGCKDNETKNNRSNEPVANVTVEDNLVEEDTSQIDVEDVATQVLPSQSVWTFDTKDFGAWSNERPYINPFYLETAYDSIDVTFDSEFYTEYVDEYASLITEVLHGDVWEMTFSFDPDKSEEENLQLLYDIEDYLIQINGRILGRYYDTVSFECLDQGHHWVGQLAYYDQNFNLTMVREKLFSLDEPIRILTEDYDASTAFFTAYFSGEIFYSLEVYKDRGDLSLHMTSNHYFGDYSRKYQQYIQYEDEYGERFHLDELPYDDGRVLFEISWDVDDPPNVIELTLHENGKLPQVKHGEALGAIKVSAEYVSDVAAYPTSEDYLSLDHKEYAYDAHGLDMTPDGDYLLYVPSGLWDVSMTPRGNALVSDYETKMVPVNAGQVTEVIIPDSVSSKLKVSSSLTEQGLEIRDVVEEGNRVTFRFTILDQKTQEVIPVVENSKVYEGGYEAKVLTIKPVDVPPSVVLLLDSSGSMKGQMDNTIAAAKAFIDKLPEDTRVQVIDFDSEPKLLDGLDKTTVLTQMDRISVGGATTLYDAIIMGLDILDEASRPNIIVFTDGEDANLNDTARGSEASFEEMIESVETHDIAIYTIGFGENHDRATLDAIAANTGGKYYSAVDQSALQLIFNTINDKIINTYDLVYERPKIQSKSDIPVVSIVVDTSGSMDEVTEEDGYRLLNVKQLLHNFLKALPDETQYMLSEFNDGTSIVQTLTTDKTLIMRGVASLEAGGGTDIEGSVEAAFISLKEVPSSKKVMIYITDAALGTTDSSQAFKSVLSQIRESDITALWVGMGVDDAVEDFELASELSGGRHVVSEDPQALKAEFDQVLQEVLSAPTSELVNIYLNVEKVNKEGEREAFSASSLVALTPKETTDDVILSETIQYKFSEIVKQYDVITSEKVSQTALPVEEVIITSRMSAEGKSSNDAASIEVKELYLIDKLNGVKAPAGYQFLSLDVSITNILPEQEVMVYPDNSSHPSSWVAGGAKGQLEMRKIAYQVPNFVAHLYLSYNDQDLLPASTATWLMGQPLIEPGNYSLTIDPDTSVAGMLTFMVPDQVMHQSSLHFYDTNYGHIHVPVVGKVNKPFDLETLPTEANENLTDTFGLTIYDMEELSTIGNSIQLEDKTVFQKVKGNFTSNVQALLDINPSERMQLRLLTEKGDFYIPVSPATVLIPGGFYQPRMMAPGAQNHVSWIFQLPQALKDNRSDLFVELQDDDKYVTVQEGTALKAKQLATFEHDYFYLHVNDLVEIQSLNGYESRYVILDITVEDKPDGYGTSGIGSMLYLKSEEDQEASVGLGNFAASGNLVGYEYETENLILGFDDDTPVFDGTSRRGFMIFNLPEASGAWQLVSPTFEDMALPVSQGNFDTDLLVTAYEFIQDFTFESEFEEALSIAVERYRLTHPASDERLDGKAGLDATSDQMDVPVPMLSIYGNELIQKIESLEDLRLVLGDIRCVPSNGSQDTFEYNLSPEALMIQQYGTEQDMAHLAYTVLARLGYAPKLQSLRLTSRGKNTLEKLTGFEAKTDMVPGIRYNDGQERLLMLPFNVLMDEVDDLATIVVSGNTQAFSSYVTLNVKLLGEYTERGINQHFSDFSDALSGETEVDHMVELEVFNQQIPMDILSLDAIDLGIGLSGQVGRCYLNTAGGEILGEETFNPDHYRFTEMIVTFSLPDNTIYEHHGKFTDEMSVDQMFISASINAPDLTKEAMTSLVAMADQIYRKADKPNAYAALKWYGRSMLSKLNYYQGIQDQSLAETLSLDIGHITRPKVYVVNSRYHNGKLTTNIDLVQSYQEIFKGSKESLQAFNIMSGLYATSLEGDIIENGYGMEDVWAQLPEGTGFFMIDAYLDSELKDYLAALGFPQDILSYFESSSNIIMIPEKPALIQGHERWAWMEFNPDTYESIGVLDDFTKGASVESVITDTVKNAGQFAVGAFKGVETSVWSVAAFSLEEDDYSEILKKAKALALGIADNFGLKSGPLSAGIGGKPSISQSVGPIKFEFDGKFDVKQNVLGFTEGYKAGVEFYFDIAK